MAIWTIYNHGTGASSLKTPDKNEIINLFGNNDRRQQYRGKIITEGAGSIGDPHKLATEYSRDAGGAYSVTATQDSASGLGRIGKVLSGGGVQENVDNTVEFIRALNLAGRKPDGINMIGWSRGAVTCIRIAWKLYQSQDANLRHIPINIFGVDPVAGAGHSTEVDACTITPNVKNYFATLAMGEKRRFFKPIAGQRLIVQDPNASRAWVLPMPGHHSDTAKNDNNVGRLVFNLAYRFLAAAGTPVPAMRHYMLNDVEAWKLYEGLMLGETKVHSTGKGMQVAMGGVGYKRSSEGAAHGLGENFFPNVHARLLMFQAFPQTYDAYFGAANARVRNTEAWARRVLGAITAEQRLNGMAPAMNRMLEELPPAKDGGVAIPANVLLMASGMRMIG
jgi:hypothetical protein